MASARDYFRRRSLRADVTHRTKASELTLRQSLFPLCLVTALFFLWGFSYGLLDTLNAHFQRVLHFTPSRSSGLQAAYFGAYPLASIGHAAWILRHYGYRAVFIWGLCLYGIGALCTIAALKAESFGGFCACIFIIGNGLGSLETAANPYITGENQAPFPSLTCVFISRFLTPTPSVCGPPRYSELRINLSQAFNGIGTVIAPVLASKVFFAFSDAKAQANVQWVYLAIAVFVFSLATVFFFADIPEVTDADMEFQAEETTTEVADKPFRKQYKLFHAAFAQFCYTGAQVAIASYFINYALDTRPGTSRALAANLLAGAQAAFAIGRFAGVGIMRFVRPRLVFGAFLTCCIIFAIPSITGRGDTGIAMLYCVLFFESVCFPTIVALGMRGLGRHTKRGSGYIVAGVVGGACVPPLMGQVIDMHGSGIAMTVPLAFFVAAWSYAFCVNFAPPYKRVIDSFNDTKVGIEPTADHEERQVEPKTASM
ncbi:Major facilitator superfamily domain, general substrate transporter [Cordyceps fumosorosea ARSEF 2679]|uniref:Major facilitator superfamily domain, general substrate transporter n=1 Tax=Cordyceps fumosorosea (strain ARSEF 2679) TaxID=1081104 RepID=A0A162MVQ5_CORFA|nr:Major facilitator superfamily domain, general substrate transporter [Cordyceps fumosorosea ARSEF 2679]OAA71299.1 Major facilitator superfamily domain, general substrate transporter [Cordyceps fumosorosea ARSEF 2679]